MNDLIMLKDLPNLEKDFEPASVDLSAEYWTPEKDGEQRRMFYWGVEIRNAPDHNNPEQDVELPCVVFVAQAEDGSHKTVVNGSKRLVATFDNNEIKRGTPVQVTYRGKKKNRSNSHMSDSWSVVTLAAKVK